MARLLITAGPTREPIDAVRYISNRSSGRMGLALAEAGREAGWDVTLLLGPVSVSAPAGVTVHRFETTQELQALLDAEFAKLFVVSTVFALTIGSHRVLAQSAPLPDQMKDGEALFQQYCAPCHGADARGDGPVAGDLKTTPPSLREIAEAQFKAGFHYDARLRQQAETALASDVGLSPDQVIVYCPSFGMALPEADVPVRMESGKVLPLSGSNNEEIRILKDKHKALWKFFVLVDRQAWHKHEALARAASEYPGIGGDRSTA